jgi:hypothetical protein
MTLTPLILYTNSTKLEERSSWKKILPTCKESSLTCVLPCKMKTTTSSTKEPRSKYGNMLWAWLIAKELRAPRKTLNNHLKSGIGYLRVVILPPSTNCYYDTFKLHYCNTWTPTKLNNQHPKSSNFPKMLQTVLYAQEMGQQRAKTESVTLTCD